VKTDVKQKFQPLLVLGLAALLAGCGRETQRAQAASQQDPGTSVIRTTAVQLEQINDVLDLSAKVQSDPARLVRVFPPAGGRIIAIRVRPGDHVREGQPLALLQSSDVASARADFQKASIERQRSTQAFARASALFEHKALAEKDLRDAEAARASADAEYERARERLQILGVQLDATSDNFELRAPRNGVVLDLGAAPGEFSKSLDAPQPLCTVVDLSSIWVVGDVYEKDVATVKTGDPVEVTASAYPGRKWNGHVSVISDQVDAVTRTLKVRVVLNNPDLMLKPEMFASIHLVRAQRQALMLPNSAVVRDGERAQVFVQSSPGKYEERAVILGRARDGHVEIADGLKPGEEVVVDGATLLRGGANQL